MAKSTNVYTRQQWHGLCSSPYHVNSCFFSPRQEMRSRIKSHCSSAVCKQKLAISSNCRESRRHSRALCGYRRLQSHYTLSTTGKWKGICTSPVLQLSEFLSLSLCVTVDWAWSAEKMTEEYCHVSQTAAETSYLQQKTCRLSQNASKQASVHHALKNAAPLQLFG